MRNGLDRTWRLLEPPKANNNLQVFHAYIYGTAFWYGLRGLCRVYDPLMVAACNQSPPNPTPSLLP
jgi:hypothetical protein